MKTFVSMQATGKIDTSPSCPHVCMNPALATPIGSGALGAIKPGKPFCWFAEYYEGNITIEVPPRYPMRS